MNSDRIQQIVNSKELKIEAKNDKDKSVGDISMQRKDLYAPYQGSFKDLLQSRSSGIIPGVQSNQEHDNTHYGSGDIKNKSPTRRLATQGANNFENIIESDVEGDNNQFFSMVDIDIPDEDKYSPIKAGSQEIQKDEVSKLMAQVDTLEQQKRGIQRLLKSENEDLADKESDLEKLHAKLHRKQREYDLLVDNHEELKQMMSDLTVRYKDSVREASIVTNREKELLEQLDMKDEQVQEYLNQKEISVKEKEDLEDEMEVLKAKHETIVKKLGRYEKQELELLKTSHEHAHELEEANFARDAALQKQASLQKLVDSITVKLDSLPKQYQEKQEIAMESIRGQFNIERKKLCETGAKMEQQISSLQADVDRAMREKRAAEKELEKLTSHLPVESDRLSIALDELHSKLISTDRERLEAIQRLETMQTHSKQEEARLHMEIHLTNETNENNHRRLKRTEHELEEFGVSNIN